MYYFIAQVIDSKNKIENYISKTIENKKIQIIIIIINLHLKIHKMVQMILRKIFFREVILIILFYPKVQHQKVQIMKFKMKEIRLK